MWKYACAAGSGSGAIGGGGRERADPMVGTGREEEEGEGETVETGMRANYKGGARMRARQLTDGAEGAQDGSEPKPRSHDRSPIAPPRFGLVRAHKGLSRANVHAPIPLERPTTRPASCKRASRDQRKTQHGDPPWQDLIGRYLITRNLIRFDIPQHDLHNLISVGSCTRAQRRTCRNTHTPGNSLLRPRSVVHRSHRHDTH